MLISADQLLAHGVGDYILQSHWMAVTKMQKSLAAAAHALTYTLPFLLLTRSVLALVVIAGTHFAIDRWRLARWVIWAKNLMGPPGSGYVARLDDRTGYPAGVPDWLGGWLFIIADNILHILVNGAAIKWL